MQIAMKVGLVGSGNFASTSRALRELSIAQQITIPIVQRMALNRHLPIISFCFCSRLDANYRTMRFEGC